MQDKGLFLSDQEIQICFLDGKTIDSTCSQCKLVILCPIVNGRIIGFRSSDADTERKLNAILDRIADYYFSRRLSRHNPVMLHDGQITKNDARRVLKSLVSDYSITEEDVHSLLLL